MQVDVETPNMFGPCWEGIFDTRAQGILFSEVRASLSDVRSPGRSLGD